MNQKRFDQIYDKAKDTNGKATFYIIGYKGETWLFDITAAAWLRDLTARREEEDVILKAGLPIGNFVPVAYGAKYSKPHSWRLPISCAVPCGTAKPFMEQGGDDFKGFVHVLKNYGHIGAMSWLTNTLRGLTQGQHLIQATWPTEKTFAFADKVVVPSLISIKKAVELLGHDLTAYHSPGGFGSAGLKDKSISITIGETFLAEEYIERIVEDIYYALATTRSVFCLCNDPKCRIHRDPMRWPGHDGTKYYVMQMPLEDRRRQMENRTFFAAHQYDGRHFREDYEVGHKFEAVNVGGYTFCNVQVVDKANSLPELKTYYKPDWGVHD